VIKIGSFRFSTSKCSVRISTAQRENACMCGIIVVIIKKNKEGSESRVVETTMPMRKLETYVLMI